MNMPRPYLTILALFLPVGCASVAPTVDNALLAEVSSEHLAQVADARADRDRAADAWAAAQRDVRTAEEQVELAQSGLVVARATLEEAKLSAVIAKSSGTVAELEAATRTTDHELAKADAARELVALRKRELEQMILAERVADEDARLSRARVELQKAEAVQGLDRVEAKQISLKDYRKQVRFHEVEVAFARATLAVAKSKADEARDEYETMQAKTMKWNAVEPAKTP